MKIFTNLGIGLLLLAILVTLIKILMILNPSFNSLVPIILTGLGFFGIIFLIAGGLSE
jgi:hypothetical protein